MTDAYICDAVRTPIGRYGGALKDVRPDDLLAVPLATLECTPGGLRLIDLVDGLAHAELERLVGLPILPATA